MWRNSSSPVLGLYGPLWFGGPEGILKPTKGGKEEGMKEANRRKLEAFVTKVEGSAGDQMSLFTNCLEYEDVSTMDLLDLEHTVEELRDCAREMVDICNKFQKAIIEVQKDEE